MLTDSNNTKNHKQSFKKLNEHSGLDAKIHHFANKKDSNSGLMIPGSNWQKFKDLVTLDLTFTGQRTNDIQTKKRNRKRKFIQSKYFSENMSQQIQITEEQAENNLNKTEVQPTTGLTKVISIDTQTKKVNSKNKFIQSKHFSENMSQQMQTTNERAQNNPNKTEVQPSTGLTKGISIDTQTKKMNNKNKFIQSKHLSENMSQQIQTTKKRAQNNPNKTEVQPSTGLTKVISMDCEMVGIGDGQDSMIARVSIVNRNGICVYDKYVKPTEKVQDYRTPVSGIRPHHLENGEDFVVVQKEVAQILKGRTLVGHALHNDLAVLFLRHPKRFQRDTARYRLFRQVTNGKTPSLKALSLALLGMDIQSGEHDSVEDARAAMKLYQLFRKKWELDMKTK